MWQPILFLPAYRGNKLTTPWLRKSAVTCTSHARRSAAHNTDVPIITAMPMIAHSNTETSFGTIHMPQREAEVSACRRTALLRQWALACTHTEHLTSYRQGTQRLIGTNNLISSCLREQRAHWSQRVLWLLNNYKYAQVRIEINTLVSEKATKYLTTNYVYNTHGLDFRRLW